jgi:hypothetical protein
MTCHTSVKILNRMYFYQNYYSNSVSYDVMCCTAESHLHAFLH